ncbi:hypothetical protein BU17DRAFT_23814, partial [Hysterangium stoloniferum]
PSRPPSPPHTPIMASRATNASTSSLLGVSAGASPQREMIRKASTVLVKELVRKRSSLTGGNVTGIGVGVLEEVEMRMRMLERVERIRGSVTAPAGEEKERKAFGETVKDGVILCHYMNKLSPGSIQRIDPSPQNPSSNVLRFLSAAATFGVPTDELFEKGDLVSPAAESGLTSDQLGNVAQTVVALAMIAEAPPPKKFVPETTTKWKGVYASGVGASASTPNLVRAVSPSAVRSTSAGVVVGSPGHNVMIPTSAQAQAGKKQRRFSPQSIPVLPTVRSASPAQPDEEAVEDEIEDVFGPLEGVGNAIVRQNPRLSTTSRTSFASSTTDAPSSLLDPRSSTRYGTVRTTTTEATSLHTDSFTAAEANFAKVALQAEREREGEHEGEAPATPPQLRVRTRRASQPATPVDDSPRRRDRKVSEVDLSRVAEETDEGGTIPRMPPRPPVVNLGQGKFPDDFMNLALKYPATRPKPIKIPGKEEGSDREQRVLDSPTDVSKSSSPPRIGSSPPRHTRVRRPSSSQEFEPASSPPRPVRLRPPSQEGIEPISPATRVRRRSSRLSTELLPKDVAALRDCSPSPIRPSSRTDSTTKDGSVSPAIPVPFPRASSAEYYRDTGGNSSLETLHGESSGGIDIIKKPYQRPRHRSDLDKDRRSSFGDQPGQLRPRYESMAATESSRAESSLIGGMDGSAVRKTLVVKEEGKPATIYQLGNCIGRGQFGTVYRALNLNTGQTVAVKRIRLEGLSETEIAQLMHEVEIVKQLSHPSIIKYEGMARDPDTLSIVLEYAENGSLAQTLKAFGKLNEALVAGFVTKVLEGLYYLHASQVVHCDLKAANILTTKTGNVKLSDFGVSLNLRAVEQIKNDVAGTPNWMAPEVIELNGASPASDIWSLACTIIELLTGRPPYADVQNSMSVMFRIVDDPMPPLPEELSEPLRDFLTLCFNKNPAERPNAETLFEHPWLKNEWGMYKELRPQDSIPFLRRVSADLQRSDVRHLTFVDDERSSSPRSLSSQSPTSDTPPRPHDFVKSTFSQAVTCRVCNHSVKKNAVFCKECSLIAHAKCAADAAENCDVHTRV